MEPTPEAGAEETKTDDAPASTPGIGRDGLPLPSYMKPEERLAGYVGAGAAGVMFVVVWALVYGVGTDGLPYLGYGLLCGVALAVAANWGNRYVAAFACVFIASLKVPYGINLAFFGLSAFFVFRATKVAREVGPARAAARREARQARRAEQGADGTRSGGGRRRARGRGAGAGAGTSGSDGAAANRRRPTASKRYTPPKASPRR